MKRETIKTARMSRKIFVFTILPENLLQCFFHMPVMGPFPIDIATNTALQELLMRMEDIIRNDLPDVIGPAPVLKLAVTAGAASPGNPVKATKMSLHLSQLIDDMI
jgi:hypothetical protein